MNELFFITGNYNKFKEIKNMFDEHLKMIRLKIAKLTKLEIQSERLEDIVNYAAKWILENTDFKSPFFIEDAGLFVDALNGFPGPYSHYVYKTIGIKGVLKLMEKKENRAASFQSVIALWDGEKISIFKGIVTGEISKTPRGVHGFGFDPIFIPKESNKTFAEMTITEKNQYSHRAKSTKKMIDYINKLLSLEPTNPTG